MRNVIPSTRKTLSGSIIIPPDKSISHRAVMFASIADGKSVINNFSKANDPISTLSLCRILGVKAEYKDDETLVVTANGAFSKPNQFLDCGNSGTTMRLMCGILAGQNFNSVLIGDDSLLNRPMKRIIEPLTMMGAKLAAADNCAPIHIFSSKLHGVTYTSNVASAQVKSSILLAGLQADGITSFTEPSLSRNHSELMLKYMNADIQTEGTCTTVRHSVLEPKTINVVGDISSAAFFMVAATIVPKSDIILKNVGLNPTRTGIIEIINRMGGNIEILNQNLVSDELVGDVRIRYSELKACTIEGEIIPRLIDELPVIAVLATQAEGQTIIKDAQDLKNKETDRIHAIVRELKKLGADIKETDDGFIVTGKSILKGAAELETYGDHRIAMSLYVAGLICKKDIVIRHFEWVNISFPEFEELFSQLIT